MTDDTEVPDGFKITKMGLVPEEWEIVKLGDVAEKMKAGGTPSRREKTYWNGEIPFVLIEDMTSCGIYLSRTGETITEEGLKNSSAWIVPPNSLLVSMYASIGKTAINTIPLATNQAILAIIPKSNFDIVFSAYIIRFHANRLIIQNVQSTQKNVNKGIVESFAIPLPPLSEQKKIAFVLSTIQKAIEKTEAVINATKELKRSLMKHLFTYGPVSVEDAENVVLKETEIGLVPEKWEVVRLKELVDRITDGTHRTPTYVERGVPFLRVTDIQGSSIDWTSTKKIPIEEHLELIKRCKPEKSDILLSKNGTIGLTKVIDWEREFSIFVSLCLIKPKIDSVNNYYLAYYLGSKGMEQIRLRGKRMTVTNLHLVEIKELLIPTPPLSVQQDIADMILTIDSKIKSEQARKKALEQIFKTLLHNLMTGKIRVTHLEVSS